MRHEETRQMLALAAEHLAEDKMERLESIAQAEGMDCAFDLAEALYVYSVHWHGGQTDPLYQLAGLTGFQPGPAWSPDSSMSVLSREFLDAMTVQWTEANS